MSIQFEQVALLGIPFDDNSSYVKGPAKAPASLRSVFSGGSLNKTTELGIDLKDNNQWQDAGDVCFEGKQFFDPIEMACNGLLEVNSKILSIGGDHSITYPIICAYAKRFSTLNILHIDAHPDLYDSFKGNKYSNASPFARIMEQGLCSRLLQVGVRTINQHQREQADKFNVEIIEMKDFETANQPVFTGPVYLSLDIDGIDPAYAPGVSHREPGGLSSRDVIKLIHNINAPLIGADIVEFNPDKDVDGLTAQLVAKLTKEVAGKMLTSCK